jgi:hypothetical protein
MYVGLNGLAQHVDFERKTIDVPIHCREADRAVLRARPLLIRFRGAFSPLVKTLQNDLFTSSEIGCISPPFSNIYHI